MNRHASINRVFRLVWNESLSTYVPAAETTRGRGKSSRRRRIAAAGRIAALTSAALTLSVGIAEAGPTGGQVTTGNGTVTTSGNTTTIQQSSQTLALNWQTFNIAPQETVDFIQPNAAAIAVNRILDPNGSVILGHLNANGQVYLINPNGVLFGKGAEVNVGGLVASTLGLGLDPGADTLGHAAETFSGSGAGRVVNEGTLTAAPGGTIALLGNHVSNSGVISAQLGSVALGAGSAATLTFNGTHLVSMQVDQSVLNSVASNGGLIRADGGKVLMTAGAQKSLLASVVNNTGVIEARTLENHDGTITLLGGMTAGTVHVDGTLDASAPNGGNGGSIETSAAHVEVGNSAKVTTAAAMGLSGTWLIDPTDFNIAPQGGDETGAQLSAALGSGNVTILSASGGSGTDGNINVNDTVGWNANTLTLSAQNNININSAMNGSGTASLVLQYGQRAVNANNVSVYNVNAPVNLPAGQNFSTKLGSDGSLIPFTVITALGVAGDATTAPVTASLQGMAATANLGGNFALGGNIDAGNTSGWNGGAGFTPIGSSSSHSFTGTFDGLGHTISNLFIDRPTAQWVGLFGFVNTSGIITNVGVVNANVTGANSGNSAATGILVGESFGLVSNSYTSGSVTGSYGWPTGGLVGNNYGTVTGSHSSSSVSGYGNVGGLVGSNYGSISNSFATGNVTGQQNYIGGLVGGSTGSVNTSYATGSVSGGSYVGGLVGANEGGSVNNSHASGPVNCVSACTSSNEYMGGLVGFVNVQYSNNTTIFGTVSNSYATGTVTGGLYVGGLVGAEYLGPITNSYSIGAVIGLAEVGGLLGNWYGFRNGGLLSNSFYDIDQVTINGVHQLTLGGIYDAQYQDWFTHGQTLNIANYSVTLPAGAGGYYDVGSVQGLRDMLGFVESDAADNFRLTADLSLPAGFSFPYFAGSFDGGNHTLSNLSLNVPNSDVGLFGYLPSSSTTIANLGVPSANVTGRQSVGGLVGLNTSDAISNSYVTGSVSGSSYVGGLVGYLKGGSISNSYSASSVTATTYIAGGLAGGNNGSISQSYESGSVNGSYCGALVGAQYGTVANSYYNSTANPSLTGLATFSGPIADVPGVVAGLTSTQLQTQSSFSGLDFGSTWFMYEGATNPLLRSFMTALTVSADNATRTYTGSAYSGGNGVAYTAASGDGNVLGSVTYSGSSQGAVHAGTYSITPSGLTSDQQGYVISYASGSLTIDPAPLTVSGTTVATKIYDGTTAASLVGGSLVGVVGGTVTLTQAGTFASKNVGTGITVTAGDSLSGPDAADYTLVEPTGLSGTITPAPLTVSGTSVAGKAYNGSTTASLAGGALVGVIQGDTVTLTQAGTFVSKDAGTGVAVTASDSIGGANAGDYALVEPTGLTGTVTPAALTVTGTTVGSKVANGTNAAPLAGGTLVGVVSGDSVTLIQSGSFAATTAGTGIAVIATDSLSGANAADYSLVEPTGLTGSILPAPSSPGGAGGAGGAGGVSAPSVAILAAQNTRAQIVQNLVYPQLGANPQMVDAAPSIVAIAAPDEGAAPGDSGAAAGSAGSHKAVAVNVSMKIGANGTLKIENGGLRLPSNLVVGQVGGAQ